MIDKTEVIEEKVLAYVITCGDEGVQINEGIRLGFVGAGVKLEGFDKAVAALKSLFVGENLRIAASEECDWIKEQLDLSNWEQTTASSQQRVEALADKEGLLYCGFLPFKDPRKLKHDIKGHMVRPHNIHVANKICFTLAGGEQTYNLGCYLISAEWVHKVPAKVAKKLIHTQIAFYKKVSENDNLEFVFDKEGILGEKVAEKNVKALKKIGVVAKE
ncbi:hypothetical protein KKD03_03165 [Patescibacteria group bacterium]|nr:hypothetical protein [Patescibacteria group bacterium]